MAYRRTGFYLDKRNAKFMGVCSGIADYTGFDALWVRVGLVLVTIMGGGPFTIIAYLVIGWMASDKPHGAYVNDDIDPEDRQFWQKTRASAGRGIREVRSSFRDIDRRLRDIEIGYTSGSSRLSNEIEALRSK
ncbi:envelope stress response membrane protein PspC [Sandaracinobacteroides saxicola]|uniref:Envelope stress response membrane protein PspC n=1 Tax=Sandaracinobacteroides saxicola TaxID=2759707 RepID=A0A7G5ILY5_9SPHN|nr:envelope stress response membrane protein PspC [Sandaracinobacteroides saxicola]QMW24377.1 envelope stress response membrane protein PspC [Sandaracinobacteroides saxicola]